MVANPSVSFIFGDRPSRPLKATRTIEHIIRDVFTAQGFVGVGIMLQTICTITIPQPYTFIPGAIFIAAASWSTVSGILGLKKESEETTRIVGRTTAYLDFGDKSHVGKLPGSLAFPTGSVPERKPPKLAIMLIGSRCQSKLGAVQPEFKEMGEVFAGMLHELRNAPPEEDVGFLNAEAYMHSGDSTNNSNMVCLYFRTYAHMIKFAHAKGGAHWDSWNKFRDLQRDKAKLGTEIGLWHEAYEISNAESIYINMPRLGLGDMWEAVPTPNGKYVYRNPLVSAKGPYAMGEGRMSVHSDKQAPYADKET